MELIPITSDRIQEIAESSCASQKSRKRVRRKLKESPPCKILRHDALPEDIMFKEIRAEMHHGQMWLEYHVRDKKIEVTPTFVENEMKKKFGIDIGYHKTWRDIQKVVVCIKGKPKKNFQILPSYLHMMVGKNPGTYTSIKRDAQNRFTYMFFALAASIVGWSYCRLVITVDATVLKSKYRGVLFVVVSKDANSQIFPLCFGVADSENNEAYIWFFGKMRKAIQVRRELVFLSDRNQSIANGIRKVFPEAHHGICLYHFEKNLKQRHAKATVINLFQSAARSYKREDFNQLMSQLKIIDKKTYNYIMEEPPERWARSWFPR
ncbi:protein FAR1-RELATED SEQUENCE 4-like [Nicotiana sylvestris]|uniref:protein FAR1-RELATED SEQUENCE 4-like n=1 Tax=Nicotiana sylvestris TaxID=4096 RepID=UPI00388CA762